MGRIATPTRTNMTTMIIRIRSAAIAALAVFTWCLAPPAWAQSASDWIQKARRYIAAHRALDEIESAALLGGGNPAP